MEQAVIIYSSKKASVSKKVWAWKELLKEYDEDAFENMLYGKKRFTEKSNKSLVEAITHDYEDAMSDLMYSKNSVLEASLWETDFRNNPSATAYFSDFSKANEYLLNEKKYYLDDEDLKDINTEAQICKKNIDNPDKEDIIFWYNNNMDITKILPYPSDFPGIESVFCYVPLPFKKGDILRTVNSGVTEYGVITKTPDLESFKNAISYGDLSDMNVTLNRFFKRDGKYVFGFDHYDFLTLERTPAHRIPEEQSILKLLQMVYKGEMDYGYFLFLYSHYGENAYDEVYR